MNAIKVLIYGNKDTDNKKRGCANKKGNCHTDGNCLACGSNSDNNLMESVSNLKKYIEQSDVKDQVVIEYIDLKNNVYSSYNEVDELMERGFETPITIIDGVVRYYGGISNSLIYNDVKELLK